MYCYCVPYWMAVAVLPDAELTDSVLFEITSIFEDAWKHTDEGTDRNELRMLSVTAAGHH